MVLHSLIGATVFFGGALPAEPEEAAFRQLLEKARQFTREGRYAEGQLAARQAVRQAEIFGQKDPRVAVALSEMAALAQFQAQFSTAERAYLRGIRILEASQAERPAFIQLLHGLGALYLDSGDRFAGAERTIRRAVDLAETALGQNHPDVGAMLNNLASACLLQRHEEEARGLFERAAAILANSPATYRPNLALAWMNLGLLEFRRHDTARALRLLGQAEAVSRGETPSAEQVKPLLNLGRAYLEVHRAHEASVLTAQAVATAERTLGPEHPLLAEALSSHAEALRKIGDKSQARAASERAKAIHALTPQAHSVDAADLRRNLRP